MLLLSAAQCRELERLAMEDLGISEAVLMESAANAVLDAMEDAWGRLDGRRIALLCGKGNNGGDGLALARLLLNRGSSPLVLLAAKAESLAPAAKLQWEILKRLGLQTSEVLGDEELGLAKAAFQSADYIVDALYGTGFHGAVSGFPAALLIAMNASGHPVVSVDLPSGVDADSGEVRGAAAYAALSVSFNLPKRGMALEPGRSFCGKVVAADIGIPLSLLAKLQGPFAELSEPRILAPLLPHRALNAHKRSAGSLLVIAGSLDYPGAALLCARAAFASGASYVEILAPEGIRQALQTALPEAVVWPLSLEKALEASKRNRAAVLGPGLGRSEASLKIARRLFHELELPLLADADALFALSGETDWKCRGPRLLTPHDGEFARLLGLGTLPSNRSESLKEWAGRSGCTTLLKGLATLVQEPRGRLSVNSSGNALLATAGSGDVLSGIAGALMAQGLGVYDAARLGAYVHGRVADQWMQEKGSMGFSASRLVEGLAAAFHQWRGNA